MNSFPAHALRKGMRLSANELKDSLIRQQSILTVGVLAQARRVTTLRSGCRGHDGFVRHDQDAAVAAATVADDARSALLADLPARVAAAGTPPGKAAGAGAPAPGRHRDRSRGGPPPG